MTPSGSANSHRMTEAPQLPAAAPIVLFLFLPDGPVGWVVLLAGVAAIVAVVLAVWRRRRPRRSARTPSAPPLIFPAAPASAARARTRPPPPLVPFASSPPPFPVPATAVAAEPIAGIDSLAGSEEHTVPGGQSRAAATATADAPPSGLFDGQTIRFHVPVDGTLQLLPGRLELVAGPDSGQIIRFVRNDDDPKITFGRSDGPPYRHVQLRVPTVSRRHAQMRLDGTRWNIVNMSTTNPLVVNGEEVANGARGRTLRDGDRIEMGELIFVYRER
jgi:membrane protein implicated in regulation of membrane protease activity